MIKFTDTALEQAKKYLENRGHGVGIRLGVQTTGCSGLAYLIEFADTVSANDVTEEQDGLQIIVDKKALAYIDGSEVDYVKQGLNEGFEFSNPNEEAKCGCGESFTV